MRHALLLLMLPLFLLLPGCCGCGDDVVELPYHSLRVENSTDQVVTIRYSAVTNVLLSKDDAGNDLYTYSIVDRLTDIPAGDHADVRVPRSSSVEIKADYNHIIHWYRQTGDSEHAQKLTMTMKAEDFVPATPSANG